MNTAALDASILGPAFLAGVLVLLTHVPLGREVLQRGIIFIDLAIAQIAGLGVIAADMMALESGWQIQVAAVTAALLGAALLTWTERILPDVQEAVIGVLFILGATGGILLLANNPHGGEALEEMLVGQILWVGLDAILYTAVVYTVVLAVWLGVGPERVGGIGFYLLFAVAVTASVQLVGVYLVFASLIVPALATRNRPGLAGLGAGMAIGVVGYAVGLACSALFDLPTGAVVVWSLVGVALIAATIWRATGQTIQGPRVTR